jgi:ribonuclease HI
MDGACSAKEIIGAYRVVMGKPEEKRQRVRPKLRWKNNIRMELQDV